MTTSRYSSPAALEQAIAHRLAARYPRSEFLARRNEVAYRRLVARMYAVEPDNWVLKGGFAMILRLDLSRTSNDVDVTYVGQAGEHAVALQALEQAVNSDLDDFFAFEIVRVGGEDEGRARRVSVRCRLGAREFARFRVDLALPSFDVPAERIEAPSLLGVEEIDALPPVLVLAWPQQIAEKVCAVFEQHGEAQSSRARDLADLGMIARQVEGLDGDTLVHALSGEAARRHERSLPNGLPGTFALPAGQERAWRANFSKASRGAPISFDDALALAMALVDPLLDGSASRKRWIPDRKRYE